VDSALPKSAPAVGKSTAPRSSRESGRAGRWLPRSVRANQILLLLTVLVPLLMVQSAIYYNWFQTRREAELQANLELARAVATNFDAYVRDVLSQESAIGVAFASPGSSPGEEERILAESIRQYPAISYYSLANPQGMIVASSSPETVGLDVSTRDYFKQIIDGKEWVVSDLMIGSVSAKPTFTIARAARDEKGSLQGAVLAYVDPDRLDSSLLIQRTGSASFALFDREGIMVYRAPETPSWDERVRIGHDPSVLKALAGEESTAIVAGPSGESRIAARVPIPSFRWAADASRSAAEVMTPIEMDLMRYAVISLLVSAAAAVGALVVGRRITVPLGRLRRHALALGLGELDHDVKPAGPAELMELADAFNRMAGEVRLREEGLRKSEAGLRFLADAGNILAASLDYETTLVSVAHVSIPRIADWCIVDMIDEDGTPRRMAAVHADPTKQGLISDLRRHPPDLNDFDDPVTRVLRSGQAELITEVHDQRPAAAGRDREEVGIMRALCPRSEMVVPLLVRGKTLGTILFASGESGRRYDSEDLALVELLARRAALAVDNARLYGEVQEAVRMRDEFFSVAAHELKTPVTSLRGFAQLAVRQLDKDGTLDPVRARQALQVIDEQSKKLSNLVTQLLDVSRLEAGRLMLHRLTADVVALVDNVVSSIQTGSPQHRITLNAPFSLSAAVDPLRLEQVITNLVDNAVKYSPQGGEIAVIVEATAPETVRISVRDHGLGIPFERRARIFDRFYQAHADSYYGGMGLGLYISREIVVLHGGQIHAEFPEDGGTRFVVSLPRGTVEQAGNYESETE
jgi:signal transduction histidine kinase/HAMP domain-containing protein